MRLNVSMGRVAMGSVVLAAVVAARRGRAPATSATHPSTVEA